MIIRVMGEIDIHCFETEKTDFELPKIAGLAHLDKPSDSDIANWLGRILDDPQSPALSDDSLKTEIEMAATYLASPHLKTADEKGFILLLILREKWPVGSKSRFKAIADRVGASHTYRLLACPVQGGAMMDDEDSLSQAEAASLREMVPMLKKIRKQFANSSGLQQFLQQLSS